MKLINLILAITFLSTTAFTQVSGVIQQDGRKITKPIKYTVAYAKAGTLVFDIVVKQDGSVKTCILNRGKSTVTDNPIMNRAKATIMNGLKFAKGTDYPQFHRGIVEIKTTQ